MKKERKDVRNRRRQSSQGGDLKQPGDFVDMIECLVRMLPDAKGTMFT